MNKTQLSNNIRLGPPITQWRTESHSSILRQLKQHTTIIVTRSPDFLQFAINNEMKRHIIKL